VGGAYFDRHGADCLSGSDFHAHEACGKDKRGQQWMIRKIGAGKRALACARAAVNSVVNKSSSLTNIHAIAGTKRLKTPLWLNCARTDCIVQYLGHCAAVTGNLFSPLIELYFIYQNVARNSFLARPQNFTNPFSDELQVFLLSINRIARSLLPAPEFIRRTK
jgi:hypothetical protein